MDTPRALAIAGSDPSGGAGIQADLKTFLAFGVYGMTAIAALTIQNTTGVERTMPVPPDFVSDQIRVVLEDIGADAIKTGMLGSVETIEAVGAALHAWGGGVPLVVDPVMTAKSGARLLDSGAEQALSRVLLPLAALVTPNAPEAALLTGRPVDSEDDAQRAAEALLAMGAQAVLLKGGHLAGPDCDDLLLTAARRVWLRGERLSTRNTHGTGCTLASAIAACLAKGMGLPEACETAKRYVAGAIRHAAPLGRGSGPVNHGWAIGGNDDAGSFGSLGDGGGWRNGGIDSKDEQEGERGTI